MSILTAYILYSHFVSGGYDKMVRIFDMDGGHSKEVYHTKRMQKLFCVKWSADNQYLITGSDETNIRLWKAEAAASIGTKVGTPYVSIILC